MLGRNALGLIYLMMLWVYANANIALKKPTKLSSTFDPNIKQGRSYNCCNSTYAVDGDYSDTVGNGDFVCAHSDSVNNQQSWWAVDLQNVYAIIAVDIFGRTDCCTNHDQSNLANFDVEIMLPTCSYNLWNNLDDGCKMNCHYQASESQRITVTCPPKTKGRYVRIRRRDMLYLVICEVEVYGHLINNLQESAGTVMTYSCGKIGYGYVGPVIGTFVAKSNIQCTCTCITKTGCVAAEYDKNRKCTVWTIKEIRDGHTAVRQTIIMEEKYVIINISGQIYRIQRHIKNKLPAENKSIHITENGEMQTHYLYYRDKSVFERVLQFYGGSCIHIPHNVCPVAFVEELKFWGINSSSLSSCCFLKYKQQTAENVLLHTYMEDQRKEKVDTISTTISKLQKLRLYGRHILEINGNSMPCKVYFAVSTFCILLAVFSIAISTLPEYRRNDSDTNVTEHEYVCSSCSGGNKAKTTSSNIPFLKDNGMLKQVTDSANRSDSLNNFHTDKLSDMLNNFQLKVDCFEITQECFVIILVGTNICFAVDIMCRCFCAKSIKSVLVDPLNIIDITLTICAIFKVIQDKTEPSVNYHVLLYIQSFRVCRLFRLIRRLKAFRVRYFTLKSSKKELFAMCMYVCFVVILLSNFIYFVEGENFSSIPHSWWFSIVTMTTLGYGDMIPKTVVGKIMASFCSLLGLLLFSLVIPVMATTYISIYGIADIDINGSIDFNCESLSQRSLPRKDDSSSNNEEVFIVQD
ncbi:Hypothetical predicted protein [Mytilus galloprovincialis]|uniref:Fucolectin tachylectin-4 pentraxin-1 domain-containing protein n=1 Tax=Mytilus galloprovincialis TaxID=29158 RepID=A0A8B6GD77_MYTGA|nr:Hypothetical predicted protein [Mytilus galloprovincialis]